MLGGGTFLTQNKILNGAYINFVSASKASATLSDRGICTMPLQLNWGVDSAVFEVTPDQFQKDSMKIFGYAYDDANLKGLRDLFCTGIRKLYAYKLTSGGVKATCTYATAKYCGTRGNDLKVVIAVNADDNSKWDVSLYLGTVKVDEQIAVSSASELVNNDYVTWITSATLAATAGTPLTGGTNGTVDGTAYQNYLNAIESYSYNVMGVPTGDSTTKALVVAFCKRLRDQVGVKFQLVLYDYASADYEGIISIMNAPSDTGANTYDLVYWVTGAEASCAVNKTLLNQKYTGEYNVGVSYTQSQLETAMTTGKFAFHNVNGVVRVLADINTFVTGTTEKSKEIFGENQSIRVMDQIANDIAVLFNTKYLGNVPNDAAGRISLWNDIVKHHMDLQDIRAIQDFESDDVTVDQGDARNAVVVSDVITIVNAMAKLYMTVTVQ